MTTDLIPDLAVRRTLKLQDSAGKLLGSCFTINRRDRQWLVTAQHVVDIVADPYEDLRVITQAGEELGELDQVNLTAPGPDIAVFDLNGRVVTPDFLLPPADPEHFFLSQDAYFLGYPYGLSVQVVGEVYPFVKKGIISGYQMGGATDFVALDGINNPGFSGGPIVIKRLNTPEEDWRVLAVVHGFRYDNVPVDGGKGTVKTNTGIVVGYGIRHAIEAIDAWPI